MNNLSLKFAFKKNFFPHLLKFLYLLASLFIWSGNVYAYADFSVDGINYEVIDEYTCRVADVYYYPEDGVIIIPSEVEGFYWIGNHGSSGKFKVTEIGNGAFSGHPLKKTFLPESIEVIGEAAFCDCYNLEEIIIQGEEWEWDNDKGDYIAKNFRVAPRNLRIIGDRSFMNCENLVTVPFFSHHPDEREEAYPTGDEKFRKSDWQLESIGESAFENCISLNPELIEDGVHLNHPKLCNLGQRAFYNCKSLSYIDFSSNYWMDESLITEILPYTFYNCKNARIYLSHIDIVGEYACACELSEDDWSRTIYGLVQLYNVKQIGAYACCHREVHLIFDSTQFIGERAFQYCKGYDIKLNNGIEIGVGAFEFSNFNSVLIDISEIPANLFCAAYLQNLEFSETVTKIGDRAFWLCGTHDNWGSYEYEPMYISSLPKSIKEIGSRAFDSYSVYGDNRDYHGEGSSNKKFEDVELPNIEYLGERAFAGCDFKRVSLSPNLKSIEKYAFVGCDTLEKIILPDIEEIPEGLFFGCTAIKDINIPETIIRIGSSAFRDCTSIKSLKIPEYVSQIGSSAFENCASLEQLTVMAAVPPACHDMTFKDVPLNTCVLQVPEEEIDEYKSALVWKEFLNIEAISESGLSDREWELLKLLFAEISEMGGNINWDISGERDAASTFEGVSLNGKHVVQLILSNYDIEGKLPLTAFKFPNLIKLDLSNNKISDCLDSSVGNLLADHPDYCTKLTSLNLSNNKISGNLSEMTQYCPALVELNVSDNCISEVNPPLGAHITTLDYSNQTLEKVIDLDISNWVEYFMTLPTVLTYDSKKRSYTTAPSISLTMPAVTDKNGMNHPAWSSDLDYLKGKLSITSTSSNRLFYGESGDLLLSKGPNSITFPTRISFRQGDANFDGDVDVIDLQYLINQIMEIPLSVMFNFTAADIVDDDQLNITDVVGMVNILLGSNEEKHIKESRKLSDNISEGSNADIYCKDGRLIISCDRQITALDVIIENAGTIDMSPLIKQGFMCSTSMHGNRIHLICYSLSGQSILAGETIIASSLDRNSEIEFAAACDQAANKINMNICRDIENSIPNVCNSQLKVENINGQIWLTSGSTDIIYWSVYDIEGSKLSSGVLESDNSESYPLNIPYSGIVIFKAYSSGNLTTKKMILSKSIY
ncbi:MAG: leucine-rich repeat protein [Muribaculaceae bacterium]|nr:leucine-rich repeat protein [Muribaculaceae bacterium]